MRTANAGCYGSGTTTTAFLWWTRESLFCGHREKLTIVTHAHPSPHHAPQKQPPHFFREPDNNNKETQGFEFQVRVQFLEIYGEDIRDLLASSNTHGERLTIRDIGNDEPEVVGATSQVVKEWYGRMEKEMKC